MLHTLPALTALALSLLVGCVTTTSDDTARGGAASAPGGTTAGNATPDAPDAGPIDRIGLWVTYSIFEGAAFKPVVLLRDGRACDCIEEDLDALDVAAIQQKHPKDFGIWRQGTDRIEVQWSGKADWEGLSKVAGVGLGSAWRSSKRYQRTTSVGTSGAGDWVGAAKELAFGDSGRFSLAGGVSTEISAATSKTAGTYVVSGYMLTLKFDDGTTQRMSAITTPDDPGHVLWLDGAAYTQ
jgi:hypothetical protein